MMRKFFIVIFFLLSAFNISGQNKLDSLLKIAKKFTADTNYVNSLNSLAWELKYSDQTKGLEYAKKADSVASLIGFNRGRAKALSNVGTMYHLQAAYDTARFYYEKSLVIYNEIGNKKGMANCLSNIGNGYYYMGNSEKALKYLLKALVINESIKDKQGQGICFVNIGNVNIQLAKYNEAIKYYLKALDIYKIIDDRITMSQCLNNIGVCYRLLKNYDDAIKYYEKSLEIRKKMNYDEGIAENTMNIGDLYSQKKDKNAAMKYFIEALKIYKKINHKKGTTVALNNIGSVYYDAGQYQTAIKYFEECIGIAEEIKTNDILKESYYNISQSYAKLADYKNAFLYHEKYAIIKDTILNAEKTKQIEELQTIYETEKKQKEIELLTKNKEIQNLTLSEQNAKLTKQRTTIFSIIALALLLLFSGYLVFNKYRLTQKNKQHALALQNLDIEQRLLRSQMNPHFIFNSLNSIQSFITQNKSSEAERYLTKFAKLMRYILENSRKPYVLLSDEINTLQLNLDLERLRFNNKFDFNIAVSSDINSENISIPPMLVQPFVENAIIHGIMNKNENGRIDLAFSMYNEDLMRCTIQDNGIGRKKAYEIKYSNSTNEHKSLGIQVTKERLELLMKDINSNVNISITDLEDQNGVAAGTKVEILFPYEIAFA